MWPWAKVRRLQPGTRSHDAKSYASLTWSFCQRNALTLFSEAKALLRYMKAVDQDLLDLLTSGIAEFHSYLVRMICRDHIRRTLTSSETHMRRNMHPQLGNCVPSIDAKSRTSAIAAAVIAFACAEAEQTLATQGGAHWISDVWTLC